MTKEVEKVKEIIENNIEDAPFMKKHPNFMR